MMNTFDKLGKVNDRVIDGLGPWKWFAYDQGAWQYPLSDWEESHRAVFLRHVTNWGTVVQAGGNLGMYPRLFSQMFDLVYTFEPDPINFHFLVNNNQVENVFKIQAALGESHNPVYVQRLTPYNVGMHQVVEAEEAAIPQLMIDDFQFKNLGLIALDIEGYEIHALRGGTKTIAQHKPVIAAERASDEVKQFLSQFGYVAKEVSKLDTIFVVEG